MPKTTGPTNQSSLAEQLMQQSMGVMTGPPSPQQYQAFYNQMNAPQVDSLNIQQDYLGLQADASQRLYNTNAGYAQQQAGFQMANLGLSEQQLGVQEGGLQRQWAEAPLFQKEQELQFGL